MAKPLFRYIALGDSTAVGVGSNGDGGYPERLYKRLKAAGFPVGILNLGLSGATSADVVGSRLAKACEREPHLVTVGIGTNDGWRMVEAELFGERMQTLAEGLSKTDAHVVISNIADLAYAPAAEAAKAWLGVAPSMITERIRELNAQIDRLKNRPRFHVVDLFTLSQSVLPKHPEYFSADGFHPSGKGYDHWAEVLWPTVENIAREWANRHGQVGAVAE